MEVELKRDKMFIYRVYHDRREVLCGTPRGKYLLKKTLKKCIQKSVLPLGAIFRNLDLSEYQTVIRASVTMAVLDFFGGLDGRDLQVRAHACELVM